VICGVGERTVRCFSALRRAEMALHRCQEHGLRGVLRAAGRGKPPWPRMDAERVISGGLQEAFGWVVKGQQVVDGAQLSLVTLGTEAGVDALLGQVFIHVGNVGLLGIG